MEQSSSYCWLIYGFCLRDLQKESDLADTIRNCSPPSETSPLFENQAISDGALNKERFFYFCLYAFCSSIVAMNCLKFCSKMGSPANLLNT